MTYQHDAPQRWRAAAVIPDGPSGPVVVAARIVRSHDDALDVAERLARAYTGPNGPALPFVAPA